MQITLVGSQAVLEISIFSRKARDWARNRKKNHPLLPPPEVIGVARHGGYRRRSMAERKGKVRTAGIYRCDVHVVLCKEG